MRLGTKIELVRPRSVAKKWCNDYLVYWSKEFLIELYHNKHGKAKKKLKVIVKFYIKKIME